MSAIELLGDSVQQGHGRAFTHDQLSELVATIQHQQVELMNQYARVEALTRLAVVVVDQLGGKLTITPTAYEEAIKYGLDVNWSEEGDIIHVESYEVVLPEVQMEDDSDDGEGVGDVPPVPSEGGAEVEVASGETGGG